MRNIIESNGWDRLGLAGPACNSMEKIMTTKTRVDEQEP
jgi:hypothetical protein